MSEPVTLAPAAVEAVARRVVELLADEHASPPTARLLDAAHLAELLGVSRATIYEHADALGAVRLGDGPRGRLRFDVETALAASNRRDRPEPEPVPATPRRRTSPRAPALLPIGGRDA